MLFDWNITINKEDQFYNRHKNQNDYKAFSMVKLKNTYSLNGRDTRYIAILPRCEYVMTFTFTQYKTQRIFPKYKC